jgi:hypothetical protein
MACVLFASRTSAKFIKGSFVTAPFRNWKKMNDVSSHFNQTHYHKTALKSMNTAKQNLIVSIPTNVEQMLHFGHENPITVGKKLESIVKSIIFLGRNGLPLRGHREDSSKILTGEDPGGLFLNVIQFRVDSGDQILHEHLNNMDKNCTWLSPRIQNEIIDICGKVIQESIIKDIKEAKIFGLMADEVADVANMEQMPLVLRYIKDNAGIFSGLWVSSP